MEQPQTWTVRRLLEWTAGFFTRKEVDAPKFSAELLLAHVLGVQRIKLYTDYERPVEEAELTRFRDLVKRAGEHEPIAYLTGKAHFFDLDLTLKPGVLIPRPDTETIVTTALKAIKDAGWEAPRVLDLCTGTGCIAAAIAKHAKSARVTAVDIDPVAIEVAGKNFADLGLSERISLLKGDLYEPVGAAEPFHLILSNPPYIPSANIAALDRSVRDFEPHRALDGGPDGLAFHRRILEGAAERLVPGGRVMLEIQFDQGPAGLELAKAHPRFVQPQLLKDFAGHNRVLTLALATS